MLVINYKSKKQAMAYHGLGVVWMHPDNNMAVNLNQNGLILFLSSIWQNLNNSMEDERNRNTATNI